MDAVRVAFAHIIDYAGLYPPAGLPLDEVIERYARYHAGPMSWMLGRLILPADQLPEAAALATAVGATAALPWPVSLLVGRVEAAEAGEVALAAATGSALSVASIEAVADTPDEITTIASAFPPGVERFIEIPIDPDPAPLLAAIAEAGCLAKVRTGGITGDKFPSTAELARFLARAFAAHVPMKATAGLHHAIRASHPMTYATNSPSAVMHGFANLAFAAALLTAGKIDEDLADALLDDDRPEVFRFGGRAGAWLNAIVTYGEFAEGRRLLRSVGSCSFEEPVDEVRRLEWIAKDEG
jgi:hypothetical protein